MEYQGFGAFYNDPFGWLGHNVFGGAEQQKVDGTQSRIDQQFSNPSPNPYSMGNPGLMSLMARQQGSINRNYADAEQGLRRSLAQRGMLGTSQETSALRQLAMDKARSLSGNEADLTANTYDKAAAFDQNQRQGLLGYLTDRRGQYQQQYDTKMQGLASLANIGARIGTGGYFA